MKLLFLAALIPALAQAGESSSAMTLSCEIHYSTWKSLTDPYSPGQELPVKQKLTSAKGIGVNRYSAKHTQTTADGRFEIMAQAIQPLKGDVLQYKMVQVVVRDTTANLAIEAAYPAMLAEKRDILQATQLVTWNLDTQKPNQPGAQLHVDCRLVK